VFDSEKLVYESNGYFENPQLKGIPVKLGNVVLYYVSPTVEKGHLYQFLQERGPLVHHLAFFVENVEGILRDVKNWGIADSLISPWKWGRLSGPETIKSNDRKACMINTMDKLGFQILLKEAVIK
jgi:hypothetical protein